jgi:hypothetical protein
VKKGRRNKIIVNSRHGVSNVTPTVPDGPVDDGLPIHDPDPVIPPVVNDPPQNPEPADPIAPAIVTDDGIPSYYKIG